MPDSHIARDHCRRHGRHRPWPLLRMPPPGRGIPGTAQPASVSGFLCDPRRAGHPACATVPVGDGGGVHVAVEAAAEGCPADPVWVSRSGGGNRVRHLADRPWRVGLLGCPSRRTLTGRSRGASVGAGTCRRKGSRREVLTVAGRVCFGVGTVLRRSRTGLVVAAGVGRRSRRRTGVSVAVRIAALPLRSRRVLVWLARPRAAMRCAAAWSRSSDRPHEQLAHRYPATHRSGVLTCLTAPPQRGQPDDVPRAGTVTTAIPAFAAR